MASPGKELLAQAEERLCRYQEQTPRDDTVVALGAFLDYLRPDGRDNLCRNIIECDGDEERLYQLGQHLVEVLLHPSKCRLLFRVLF